MQIRVYQTPYLKCTYHPSMRPLKSHQDSMVYDPRQPQQLRYQWWCCGVAAKHTESPWENSKSEIPFRTIIVEAGLGMIFLLQTPIVNYYSHGLPIYWTHKT
jgi:hypothetical protein